MNLSIKLLIIIGFSQTILCADNMESINSSKIITTKDIIMKSQKIEKKLLSAKKLDFDKIQQYEFLLLDYMLVDRNILFIQKTINKSIELYGLDSLETKVAYLTLAYAYIRINDLVSANNIYNLVDNTIENMSYEKKFSLKLKLLQIKASYEFLSAHPKESKKLNLSILNLVKKHLGESSIFYIRTLHILAKIELHLKSYDDAFKYIMLLHGINTKHSITLNLIEEGKIQITLAHILSEQKKYVQAEMQLQSALKKFHSNEKRNQPITVKLLAAYSHSLLKTSHYKVAISNALYALEIQNKIKIKENIDSVYLFVYIGAGEEGLNHYNKAKEAYEKALQLLKRITLRPNTKNDLEDSIKQLIQYLKDNNRRKVEDSILLK